MLNYIQQLSQNDLVFRIRKSLLSVLTENRTHSKIKQSNHTQKNSVTYAITKMGKGGAKEKKNKIAICGFEGSGNK